MRRFKRIQAIFAALVLLLMVPFATAQASTPVQDARNGVVRIAVIEEETGDLLGWGSGFFVGEAGKPVEYIVTNAHVAGMYYTVGDDYFYKEDDSVYCIAVMDTLYNSDSTLDCQVVKIFEDVDLAILKLSAPTTQRSALTLKSAEEVGVTDTVYAMGFPWSAEVADEDVLVSSIDHITVTKGSITREISQLEDDRYLQIDTTINQGNSGGPLVTEDGCVVGIVSATRLDAQNTNFALYIDYAMDFLDQTGIAYEKAGGTSTSAAEPETPAAITDEPIQAPAEEPAATPEEVVVPPDTSTDMGQTSTGRSNLILIVGGVALLALLGGGIFLMTSKRKKPMPGGSTPDGSEGYTPPEDRWICPNCGQSNDARFCEKCGKERPGPVFRGAEPESRAYHTDTGFSGSGEFVKGKMKTSPDMHFDEGGKSSGSGTITDEHFTKPALKTSMRMPAEEKSSPSITPAPRMKSSMRAEAASDVGGDSIEATEKTAEITAKLKSSVSAPEPAPADPEVDSYFKRPKDL
jgi:S1-C subfamily serine protease